MTKNLTLPSVPGMTWSTSNPAVVTAQGVVTRPAVGPGDGQATLTATFTYRGLTDTKAFPITVKQRVAIPAGSSPPGLVHYYKLDETAGPRWPTRARRAPPATRRWSTRPRRR